VAEILRRATAAGVSWPLPVEVDDATLEARLYPETPPTTGTSRPVPEWATVHQELTRKGVTLALLWQEYQAAHPDGYQYRRFCDRYGVWLKTLDRCLRHEHRAGEKLFVDYAGQTMAVRTRSTGALREAQIFVAVLGASNYTYTEATWTQTLPDWTASHVRAFAFFGGVPQIVVPDYVARHIIEHLLSRQVPYAELGAAYLDPRDREYATRRYVKQLERLGHRVILESAA
jgi:transposase